jgi:hypothetical protein
MYVWVVVLLKRKEILILYLSFVRKVGICS